MWATIDDIRERLATEKGRITIGSEDTDTFTEDEVSKAIDLAHLRLKNKFQISDEVEGEIDTTKPVGALLKECEILSTCLDLLSRLPQNELVVELEEKLKSRYDLIISELEVAEIEVLIESLTNPQHSNFKISESILRDGS